MDGARSGVKARTGDCKKGDDERTWAFHDGRDLGKGVLAKIARQFGYTIDELRKL